MSEDIQQATQLWLIRHAPVANSDGLVYGRRDLAAAIPAPEIMQQLAHHLPSQAVWITSPLRRAADTMSAILSARGEKAAPIAEPGLAEQDFGDWEGRPTLEAWGILTPEAQNDPARVTPPGGESFGDVFRRVDAATEALLEKYCGRNIVIVAHSGSIRAVLGKALALDPSAALRLAIGTLSLSRCDYFADSDGWRVEFINRPAP
ncbi:MAG: histidine phosphatase family protein [Alphaproteobacteria bacterium]